MALNLNTAPAANSNNENWKAQGFLNFYLPARNGTRSKLGSIPLRDSRLNEKELLAWLNEDPARVSVIINRLELEYQPAVQDSAKGFMLD